MSHINTALSDEQQDFYDGRVRLLEEWGMDEAVAMKRAYAEMLHRFLPADSVVLLSYPVPVV